MKNKKVKSKAKKFDKGKPNLSYLPYDALVEIAYVMEFGARKYGNKNFRKGHSYTRLINAALRHLYKFNEGIDLDDDSHLTHLGHCASNLLMLLWMVKNKPEMDDRDE